MNYTVLGKKKGGGTLSQNSLSLPRIEPITIRMEVRRMGVCVCARARA